MTAATLTFGVTDLALDKAYEAEATTRPPVPRGVAAFIVRTLGSFVAGKIERGAREMAELAVWFNGAVATLAEERVNAHVDLNDEVVPALEQAEASLLAGRAQILELAANFPQKDSRIYSALRAHAHAAADLYEAVSAFKWAVMENDADVDIANGNCEVFEDADSLLAALKS